LSRKRIRLRRGGAWGEARRRVVLWGVGVWGDPRGLAFGRAKTSGGCIGGAVVKFRRLRFAHECAGSLSRCIILSWTRNGITVVVVEVEAILRALRPPTPNLSNLSSLR
jgi:hypothetical protein